MNSEGYYFKIGAFAYKIVSDRTFACPHLARVLFANAPQEQLIPVLNEHNLDSVPS